MTISTDTIQAAAERTAPYLRHTPVLTLDGAEFGLDSSVILKLELFQHSGSFKARGAFNHLLGAQAAGQDLSSGVAAASGGNHGAAVAHAASVLKVPATIFVPAISSPAKIDRIKATGADVHVEGERYADALALCDAFRSRTGAMDIHAYDSPETLIGQATLGLEWEAQSPEMDTCLIAIGGGGLVGGLAHWFQGRTKIIGVEPYGASAMYKALQAGEPVDVEVSSLAADSLGAKRCGTLAFEAMRLHGSGVVLVPDEAIREAQLWLWQTFRIAAEPGGVAALAALRCDAYRPGKDERLGILICGGNLDPKSLST